MEKRSPRAERKVRREGGKRERKGREKGWEKRQREGKERRTLIRGVDLLSRDGAEERGEGHTHHIHTHIHTNTHKTHTNIMKMLVSNNSLKNIIHIRS